MVTIAVKKCTWKITFTLSKTEIKLKSEKEYSYINDTEEILSFRFYLCNASSMHRWRKSIMLRTERSVDLDIFLSFSSITRDVLNQFWCIVLNNTSDGQNEIEVDDEKIRPVGGSGKLGVKKRNNCKNNVTNDISKFWIRGELQNFYIFNRCKKVFCTTLVNFFCIFN